MEILIAIFIALSLLIVFPRAVIGTIAVTMYFTAYAVVLALLLGIIWFLMQF